MSWSFGGVGGYGGGGMRMPTQFQSQYMCSSTAMAGKDVDEGDKSELAAKMKGFATNPIANSDTISFPAAICARQARAHERGISDAVRSLQRIHWEEDTLRCPGVQVLVPLVGVDVLCVYCC